MDFNLAPHVQVRFNGITWHRWRAGHVADIPRISEAQSQSTDCTLWLNLRAGVQVCALGPNGQPEQEWELPEQVVFLWPMSMPRRILTPTGGEWISLSLRVSLFDRIDLFQSLQLPRQLELSQEQWRFLRESADYLLRLCHGDDPPAVDFDSMGFYGSRLQLNYEAQEPTARWLTQSVAQSIFGVCWMASQTSPQLLRGHRDIPAWLLSSLEHLEREPALKVSEMAAAAGFSPAQFRRLFVQWIGLSPQQYLHQHRMDTARRLLEAGELSVGEISHRLGFDSISHFSRIFKGSHGQTPLRYRQSFLRALT